MRFRAVLELHGRTATGIEVPPDVVAGLGSGERPAVRVTLGEHTYRSTVARRGGRYLLPVSAKNREAAGLRAGEEVTVELTLDTQPREVSVPADLAEALARVAGARRAFDALSYTRRKEHVRSVEEAKRPETRQRRIERTLESLR